MGKVRGKLVSKSKTASSSTTSSSSTAVELGNEDALLLPISVLKRSGASAPLNLTTSGKITKKSASGKKSVTFSRNLTDVLASGGISAKALLGGSSSDADGFISSGTSGSSGGLSLLPLPLAIPKSSSGKGLKKEGKKARMKIRREAFRKKVEMMKESDTELRLANRRQKTVIVGDMKPMLEALADAPGGSGGKAADNPLMDLEGFVAAHNLEESKNLPKKRKINMKKRQKEIAEGLKYFEAGLAALGNNGM